MAPGGTSLTHILEVVDVLDDRSELAPVSDFLDSLSAAEQLAMYARFEKLERAGFLGEPAWRSVGNWFKRLQHVGNVWEVGDDNLVRFYGFHGPGGLLLTNGSKKRGGKKTPPSDVALCERMRERFHKERGHG